MDASRGHPGFFSFCDGVSLKVSNRATFQGNSEFCKLRWLRQMRSQNFQNEDDCILRIAADGLHCGVNVFEANHFSRRSPLAVDSGCSHQRANSAAGTAARATKVETDDVC